MIASALYLGLWPALALLFVTFIGWSGWQRHRAQMRHPSAQMHPRTHVQITDNVPYDWEVDDA